MSRLVLRVDGLVRAAALCGLLAVSGCATGGFGLKDADVDPTILTGSVETAAAKANSSTQLSDEVTIRNAVSSADLEAAVSQPLAWANSDTGSRGAISKLTEREDKGLLCRSFTASRESFDGVGLFAGDTCRTRSGAWQIRTFKPL